MKVLALFGTRPEIIKMAPVLSKMHLDKDIDLVTVNAGQHYDYLLSQKIFTDLEMIKPDYELSVGSGTHTQQTSFAMLLIENIIRKEKPDVVISEGDTNTVLATALASIKMNIPHAHIEAGLRSFDRNMPEEVNRLGADHFSEVLFAPTEISRKNLLAENIPAHKIHVTGNTIVDALFTILPKIKESKILSNLNLDQQSYILVTAHRPENVDSKEKLGTLMRTLCKIDLPLIFPIHPRTKNRLLEFGFWEQSCSNTNLNITEPVGYIDMLNLIKNAKCVLTDSGGLQEEACVLNTPCLTLRYNTERPESVIAGSNKLVGIEPDDILENINRLKEDKEFEKNMRSAKNPFGDGTAGKKIIQILKKKYEAGELKIDSSDMIKDTSFFEKLNID